MLTDSYPSILIVHLENGFLPLLLYFQRSLQTLFQILTVQCYERKQHCLAIVILNHVLNFISGSHGEKSFRIKPEMTVVMTCHSEAKSKNIVVL